MFDVKIASQNSNSFLFAIDYFRVLASVSKRGPVKIVLFEYHSPVHFQGNSANFFSRIARFVAGLIFYKRQRHVPGRSFAE